MSMDSAISFIKQQYDKERSPLLRFLALSQEDLQDHIQYTSYVFGKFSRKLTRLEEQYETTKVELEELRAALIKKVAETVNPKSVKGECYSVTYAEKAITAHSRLMHLKRVLIKVKHDMNNVKRYLRALELKVTLTPGAQGLFNKQHEADTNADREMEEG